MSFFSELKQYTQISTGNTSTANLNPAATFTGTKESTLGYAAIQINFKADQNCTIYVDQAPDDVPNWDITDTFDYFSSLGGTGFTVQATGANFRVRIKNVGAAATTVLRLATVLCPIVEALPRALSSEGNLKVGVYEIEGDIGTRTFVTPMNALKVAEATRLIGAALSDTFDPNFWSQTVASGTATTAVTQGVMILSTGTTTASSNIVNSQRTARYIAGVSNYCRLQVRTPAVTGANTRRWGAFNAQNGFFFEWDGTTFKCVARKAGSDTPVNSGSFNGVLGATYTPTANATTYEIFWTNKSAWFFIDGTLLHKTTGTATSLTATPHLQLGFENTNGANTNNNTLEIRVASIARLGKLGSNAQYSHISSLSTNVLKYGPGILKKVVIGTAPATAAGTITIYDNTAGSGAIIALLTVDRGSAGGGGARAAAIPYTIDFDELPFNTGLTVVAATTAIDFTVIYE